MACTKHDPSWTSGGICGLCEAEKLGDFIREAVAEHKPKPPAPPMLGPPKPRFGRESVQSGDLLMSNDDGTLSIVDPVDMHVIATAARPCGE